MATSGHNEGVNLAALWVPVMPETSHLNEAMKEAGNKARQSFEQGMTGGGDIGQIGATFGDKFMTGFMQKFSGAEFGLGISRMFEAVNGQVDEHLASKLSGQLPQAYRAARQAAEELDAIERKNAETKAELTKITNTLEQAQQQHTYAAKTVLPLMIQRNQLERELAEGQKASVAAQEKASATMERHVDLTNKYNAASQSTFTATNLLAGAMGGLAVGGVQLVIGGFEKLIELGAEVFEKVTEGAGELAEKLLEVGEEYHNLEIQGVEFSSATGEAFEEMQKHVSSVFGQLDVAGKDLGKTYSQLQQMLDLEPGPELDKLAKNITDLQGRFVNLRSQDIGAIFHIFKVPVDELNSSLATLIKAGQDSGQGLAGITSSLAKAGPVLDQAHLSLGQAAAVIGDIEKSGIPATQVMTALQSAMKLFAKQGDMDFASGLRELLKELSDPGLSEGAKQGLAEAAFGTRRWGDALTIAKEILDDIDAGPNAFNAPAESTDRFIEKTETLSEKLEAIKHQAEELVKPFGEGFLAGIEEGLHHVSDYLKEHKDEIITDLVNMGHSLINFLPTLQHWVSMFGQAIGAAVTVMAPFVQGTAEVVGAAMALADVFQGHFKDAWNDIQLGQRVGEDLTKAGEKIDDLSKKFGDIHIPTDQWNQDLDHMADKAHAAADGVDHLGQAQSSLPNPSIDVAPSLAPPAGSGPFGFTPGGSDNPFASGPFSKWGQHQSGGPGASVHPSAFTGGKQEMARAIYSAVTGAGYSSQVGIAAVAAALHEDPSLDPNQKELGGSDHIGLFQEDRFKPRNGAQEQISWFISALNAAGGPAVVNADPSTVIANQVEKGGYPGSVYDLSAAAALLGIQTAANGTVVEGGRGGIDDVLIRATRGERVMSIDASRKWGPLLDAMNNVPGFKDGGTVGGSSVLQVIWDNPRSDYKVGEASGYGMVGPGTDQPQYYGKDWKDHHGHVHTSWSVGPDGQPYGLRAGTDIRPGASGFPAWVYQLGAMYGLQASTYAGHQEFDGMNHGIDWWPAGVQDMSGQSYTESQLAALDGFASGVASFAVGGGANGGSVPADFYQGGDSYPNASFASWHGSSSGKGGHGGGSSFIMGGGPDGSYGPNGTRGLPGQYGGYGTYGGETYDEVIQHNRDIEDRKGHIDDLTKERDKLQNRELPQLKQELADAENQPPLLQDKAKIQRLHDRIEDLQTRLDKITDRELPRAEQDLDSAQRKSDEAANKSPHKQNQGKEGRDRSYDAAKSFGSGFLSGIAQELGFPDIFGGKAPWDFTSVKLLTHGLGMLMSWGKQIGQQMGQYGDSGGDDGGLAGGFGGGLGLPNFKLPGLSPSQGDQQQFPVSSGNGTGPLPGPGNGPVPAVPGIKPNTHMPQQNQGKTWYSGSNGGGGAAPSVYHAGDTYHIQSAGDSHIASAIQDHKQSWSHAQQSSVSIPHPAG